MRGQFLFVVRTSCAVGMDTWMNMWTRQRRLDGPLTRRSRPRSSRKSGKMANCGNEAAEKKKLDSTAPRK